MKLLKKGKTVKHKDGSLTIKNCVFDAEGGDVNLSEALRLLGEKI